MLSASYVGSQNRHQNYYSETDLVNQSLLAGFQADSAGYNAAVPYLGYHSIRMAKNEANGDYNSLQVSMRGTLAKNDLNYSVGYTFAKSNDSFNSGGSAGDLYNISNPYAGWKYDFGPSNFSHENVFFANFVYQIPLLKNSQNKLLKTTLGGWEVAGIIMRRVRSSSQYRIERSERVEHRSEHAEPSRPNRLREQSAHRQPVVQYLDLFNASTRTMGQHAARSGVGTWPRQLERLPLQELRIQRSTRQQLAVPRGVLQHLEPHSMAR